MLGLAIILPVIGTFLYARVAFGRIGWWQFGVGLVAYHGLILMGFLNFDLGIGCALICASGWIAFREKYPWLVIAVVMRYAALVLFFIHLFSHGLFYKPHRQLRAGLHT